MGLFDDLIPSAAPKGGGMFDDLIPPSVTGRASGGIGAQTTQQKKADAIWGGSFDEWKARKEADDAERARMVAESEAGNVGSRRAQEFQRQTAALNEAGIQRGEFDAGATGEMMRANAEKGIGGLVEFAGGAPKAVADFYGFGRELDETNAVTEAGAGIGETGRIRERAAQPLLVERPDSLLSTQGLKYIAQQGSISLPTTGAGLAISTVNPALGLGVIGASAGGAKFSDARAEGRDFWLASEAAAVSAATEAVPEMLPMLALSGRLLKYMPTGTAEKLAKMPGGRGVMTALAEGGSEVATDLGNLAYEIEREGKEYTPEQVATRLVDSFAIGTAMGGVVGGLASVTGAGADAYERNRIEVERLSARASLQAAIKPRATTNRILGDATPAAAQGASIADDAFRSAGVGTVAAADIAEQDALDVALRDQLGSEAEIDSLLTGGSNGQAQLGVRGTVPDGQDAGRAAVPIPGIGGSLPAGVRARYAGDQGESDSTVGFVGDGSLGSRNAPAPQQFRELADGSVFVPGDPVLMRQRLTDAGSQWRGAAQVRDGVPGVRFGRNAWPEVQGVVGGSGSRTDVPSAESEGRGDIRPPVTGSALRADLPAQGNALDGGNDRSGLARPSAVVGGVSPAGIARPTQAEAAVDGREMPVGLYPNDGEEARADARRYGASDIGLSGAADNRQAAEQVAGPEAEAPPALRDLTDDERSFWPALRAEVNESVMNPGGRAILDPATGKVVGRTKPADLGPVSGFWRTITNSKWNSKAVIGALDAAANGEKLSVRQKNIVEYAKKWVREYTAESKAEFTAAESDSRLDEREQTRNDILDGMASVADTSPQQRASTQSLGSDYTQRLLTLKKDRRAWGLNPQQEQEYQDLLELDREVGKVGGRPMVGVRNKTAYVDALDAGELLPVQGFTDADDFKALNDKLGHEAGDDAIREIGSVLAAEFGEGNVFHRSGDEFLFQGVDQADVDAKMQRVRDRLSETVLTATDASGTIREQHGIGLSYGTGPDEASADAALVADKQRRKESGQRVGERRTTDRRGVGSVADRGRVYPGQGDGESTPAAAEGVGDAPQDRANPPATASTGGVAGKRGDADGSPDDVGGSGSRAETVRGGQAGSREVSGGTVSSALAELTRALGARFTSRLKSQKWFHLVESIDQLPPDVRKSITDADGVAGFMLPDGRVFVVAGNIEPGKVTGVVLHEVGVHFGMSGILGDDFAAVLAKFKRQRAKDSKVDEAYRRAESVADRDKNGELTDDARKVLDEEALAYYVENNWDAKTPTIQRVVDAIKRLLNRLGIPLSALDASPTLLRDIARGAAAKATEGRVTVKGGKIVYHKAWHGSPHDFDKFRLDDSTIGTGEGAQAFGHGLYFAGRKELGDHYRKALSGGDIEAHNLSGPVGEVASRMKRGMSFAEAKADAIAEYRDGLGATSRDEIAADDVAEYDNAVAELAELRRLNEGDIKGRRSGRLYEVELAPDESDYLDWDAPLSEQSDLVKRAARSTFKQMDETFLEDALDRLNVTPEEMTGREFYKLLAKALEQDAIPVNRGSKTERYVEAGNTEAAASASLLDDEGVPGIRYLDGSSRGNGEGSRNYVIFDDSSVEVKAKYSRRADGGSVGGVKTIALDTTEADEYFDRIEAEADARDEILLYHVSPNPDLRSIDATSRDGAADFGGVFAGSRGVLAWGYGGDSPTFYEVRVPRDKYISSLADAPQDVIESVVAADLEDLTSDELSSVVEMVRNGTLGADGFDILSQYDADEGGAGWRIQKMQGQVASKLGYLAIGMNDESMSDLVLPGADIRKSRVQQESDDTRQAPPREGLGASGPKYSRRADTIEVNGQQRPTTDSTGKRIHPTDEGVRNFWRWFGDSKVVDAEGHPLVVYHGTPKGGFDSFNTRNKKGATQDFNAAMGAHFTESQGTADRFAEGLYGNGDSPQVYQVYLKIDNPLSAGKFVSASMAAADERRWNAEIKEHDRKMAAWHANDLPMEEFAALIESDGIDAAFERQNQLRGTPPQAPKLPARRNPVTESDLVEISTGLSYESVVDMSVRRRKALGVKAQDALKAMGYDGVSYRNSSEREGWGTETWIIFNPTQAKSAESNSGAFSPTDKRIAYSRRTPADARAESAQKQSDLGAQLQVTPGQSFVYVDQFTDDWRGQARKMRERIQDKLLSVRDAQKDIEQIRGAIEDAANVYRRENLMHGRVGDQRDKLQAAHVKPLIEAMAEAKVSPALMEDYLEARHAKERNEKIAATKGGMPDGASGMTTQQAEDFLQGRAAGHRSGVTLDPAMTRQVSRLARKVDAITTETRRRLLDSGQITQATFDAIESAYAAYVPLRGKDGKESGGGRGTGKGIDVRGKPLQRAAGRGEGNRAQNILAEIIADAERSIVNAEKLRVGRTLARLVLENPNPDVWSIEPVKTELKVSDGTPEEIYESIKNLDQEEGTILVKVKGKPYRIVIEDQRMAEALKNMAVETVPEAVQYVAALNRYFSAVLTRYNPSFVGVNMTRDMLFGLTGIWAEHGTGAALTAAKSYFPAMRAVWRDIQGKPAINAMGRYAREFAEAGGKTHFGKLENVEDLAQRIGQEFKTFRQMALPKTLGGESSPIRALAKAARDSTLVQTIEAVNDTVENTLRLSVYAARRDAGASVEQAAEYAKNISVNFNRRGSTTSWLNALYLFWNAATQGAHRVLVLARNPKVKAALGGLAALQATSAMFLMGLDDEDGEPLWDSISPWDKQRNLIFAIPIKRENGWGATVFKIPMPYGFNLFPYMGGRTVELARDLQEKPVGKAIADYTTDAVVGVAQAMSPLPFDDGWEAAVPYWLRIFTALQSNKSDLGIPIRAGDQYDAYEKPRSASGRDDTPRVFKMLSTAMNRIGGGDDYTPPYMKFALDWAPEDLAYLFKTFTGGLGSNVVKTGTLTEKLVAGVPVSFKDVPILSSFVSNVDQRQASSARYYDHKEAIEREVARQRDIARETGDTSDNPMGIRVARSKSGSKVKRGEGYELEGKSGSLFDTYKQTEKEIKRIRDEMRATFNDQSIGYNERIRKIDELKNEREEVQRELNAAWRESRAKRTQTAAR